MFLDATKLSDIHRLLSGKPEGIEKIRHAEISLTASMFLALSHYTYLKAGNVQVATILAQLNLPGVDEAIGCLKQIGTQSSPEPFGSPSFDLYRINSAQDLLSHEWSLFYDRFRRSAARGRAGNMFRSVSGVLGEMGDNVVCHAYEAEDKPCPALAGFYITQNMASFCVADCGRGFLRSLMQSPTWSALKTENQALDAVVNKQATSRPNELTGGGFKQLFNSLLDFNGLVILRSGGCMYFLKNCRDVRQLTIREGAAFAGSSVTVIIAPQGQPIEEAIKIA
jgi:hypothetical protein